MVEMNPTATLSKKQLLWKNIKKSKHYYILLAPYAILFLTFTIVPVFMHPEERGEIVGAPA